MKHQRNLVQTKIPQTPEKGPSETELINIPERDFKIKIINMLMEVQKNIQEPRNKFKMEIQSLRKSISEMKHTMEIFKSRLVEEMVNVKEIREEEYKEAEAQREKRISKNERI